MVADANPGLSPNAGPDDYRYIDPDGLAVGQAMAQIDAAKIDRDLKAGR